MEQPVKKEGMSRGCMIGLIVAGVLLIVVVALVVTCYMKRDEIMQFGMRTMIRGAKTEVLKSGYGMDTTSVNTFFDTFTARIDSVSMDDPAAQTFFQKVADIANDGKVDSAEVVTLMDEMVALYPDMESLRPHKQVTMDSLMQDSLMMDSLMNESAPEEMSDSSGQ